MMPMEFDVCIFLSRRQLEVRPKSSHPYLVTALGTDSPARHAGDTAGDAASGGERAVDGRAR